MTQKKVKKMRNQKSHNKIIIMDTTRKISKFVSGTKKINESHEVFSTKNFYFSKWQVKDV